MGCKVCGKTKVCNEFGVCNECDKKIIQRLEEKDNTNVNQVEEDSNYKIDYTILTKILSIVFSLILIIIPIEYFLSGLDLPYLAKYGGMTEFLFVLENSAKIAVLGLIMLIISIIYIKISSKTKKLDKIIIYVLILYSILSLGFGYFYIKPQLDYKIAKQWFRDIEDGKNFDSEDYKKYFNYFSNNLNYEDNVENLKYTKYLRAKQSMSEKDYSSAIQGFNSVLDYKDSKELIEECKNLEINDNYENALNLYQEYKFEESKTMFEKINGSYKEKDKYLQRIDKIQALQGKWSGTVQVTSKYVDDYSYNITHSWIIDGDKCYNLYDDERTKNGYTLYYCSYWVDVDMFYVYSSLENRNLHKPEFSMSLKSNTIQYAVDSTATGTMVLNKISNETTLPKTTYIREPAIGMTQSEVRNSTWGSPQDINRTTTVYGVREQWCYSGYRYIYFDDGIVTSIQD